MPEGRQSPPPEEQSGKQVNDTPGSGTGLNQGGDNKETSKSQLEGLESNPKGPLEAHREATVSKTEKTKEV